MPSLNINLSTVSMPSTQSKCSYVGDLKASGVRSSVRFSTRDVTHIGCPGYCGHITRYFSSSIQALRRNHTYNTIAVRIQAGKLRDSGNARGVLVNSPERITEFFNS